MFSVLLTLCLAKIELKASIFLTEVFPASNYELGTPQDSVKKKETQNLEKEGSDPIRFHLKHLMRAMKGL